MRLSGGINCDVQLDEISQDAIITDILAPPSIGRSAHCKNKAFLAAQAGNGLACIIYLNGRLIRRKPLKLCQMAVIQRNAKKTV